MDITARTPAPVGADLAVELLLASPEVEAFARRTATEVTRARVSEALLPALTAALWHLRDGQRSRALALLVSDDDAARSLADDVGQYLPHTPVGYLPSRGATYGSGLEPAAHLVGERNRALHVLERGGFVAVSADALIERIPAGDARPAPISVELGEEIDFEALVKSLAAAGYERKHNVEERGEFSVRGGLIDVFASTGREPIRIELFGDQVERVSAFSLFTQRSLRDLGRVDLYPAAEERNQPAGWGQGDQPDMPAGLVALTDELQARAGVVAWNPDALAAEVREEEEELAERLRDPEVRGRGYVRADRVAELIDASPALEEMPLGQPQSFEAQPPALASVGIAEAENELRALLRAGYRVIVCFPHTGEAERTRLALRRVEAEPPGGGPFTEPGRAVRDLEHPPRLRVALAAARGAALPSALPPPRPAGPDRRWGGRSPRSPTCARATTSCTRITASAASSGSTPRRSPGSCATTCTWSSRARTGCTCRTISWPRSAATWAPTAGRRRSRSSAARRGRRSRPARGSRCGSWPASCSRCTPAAST